MLLVFILGADDALVAPPVPAGGDAITPRRTSGSLAHVLCNGALCVRSMSLKDAGSDDGIEPSAAGDRALVFRATVSNEARYENRGHFDVTLAGADGVTFAGRPLDGGWILVPGATGHAANGFSVPRNFVPTTLVLFEAVRPRAPAFRIAIRPSDLPC